MSQRDQVEITDTETRGLSQKQYFKEIYQKFGMNEPLDSISCNEITSLHGFGKRCSTELQLLICTCFCITAVDVIRKRTSILYLWKSPSYLPGLGHISLLLPNGVYISFYPMEQSKIRVCLDEACPVKFYGSLAEEKEDLKREPVKGTFIVGLDVESITRWWTSFVASKPKYDLKTQNCAIVVFTALCKGSDWFVHNTGNCLKTPERVFSYVKKGYNEKKNISCGKTCMHCFQVMPYKFLGCICRHLYSVAKKKPFSRIFGLCYPKRDTRE